MKNINKYINEKLHITTKSHTYSCHPKTKDELKKIIFKRIEDDGSECDLNDIDVSNITDMSNLFSANSIFGDDIFKDFNGDISQWDVSNVTNMRSMFYKCEKFNCDLSDWDVSNVEDTRCMFLYCKKFKQNLDNWDVSNVKTMGNAFIGCPTQPKWYKE